MKKAAKKKVLVDEADIVAIVKRVAKTKPRLYATYDFGRERDDSALSLETTAARADTIVAALRKALPPGWIAFIGTMHLSSKRAEVVVGRGESQFDILRIARSDACNFGLDTEDLITTLRTWDKTHDIDIFQASTDTVGISFAKVPDAAKLARKIHRFCPDVVDQGLGTIEALEKLVKKTKQISLWWD